MLHRRLKDILMVLIPLLLLGLVLWPWGQEPLSAAAPTAIS